MRKISYFHRGSLLVIVCFIVLNLLLTFLLLLPELHRFFQQKATINQYQRYQDFQQEWKKILLLKGEKCQKENSIKELEQQMVFSDDLYQLISSLESTLVDCKVELISFELGKIQPGEYYFSQNIELNFRGQYRELVSVLLFIQEKWLYRHMSFAIQPFQEKVDLVVKLSLYVQSQEGGR